MKDRILDAQKVTHYPVLVSPVDIQSELDFHWIFPKTQKVELELGSGDGSFITQRAKLNPQTNFIGVERLLGRLRKIERFARQHHLENLRGFRHEISYLLRYLLPEESISKIHVYFPDPWPKKKHARNRLFRPPFTRWASRVLEPGGQIYVKTDNKVYFEQLLDVFAGDPEFQFISFPEDMKSFKTEFELFFNDKGIETNYAVFQKVDFSVDAAKSNR